MAVYSFDGSDLKIMLQGALETLGQAKNEIDALNVFPVPDGDTGTNMYNTLCSALDEVMSTNSDHIGLIAEAAARGGLMGARGNSGVILSQVLFGFARSLRTKERASASDIALALEIGAEMAYQAVISPVEGTILTVVRKSAEGASAKQSRDLLRLMVSVLKNALVALRETPEMLPVLKQAGVVDAGGKGYVVILEGILKTLKSASPLAKSPKTVLFKFEQRPEKKARFELPEAAYTISFIYCTELLVKGPHVDLGKIKEELYPYGDSLLVVGNKDLAKVHIHTNHPGLVLESCLNYGTLHELKINNMLEQHMEVTSADKALHPRKEFAVISVGAGEGISNIFENLGTDAVVSGGQTMNPSAGEILKTITEADSEKIILLPNNKNIILAAEQAGGLSQKDVTVIRSKTIPQGISALLTLNPRDDYQTAAKKMAQAIKNVRTGEITIAIRDTNYKKLSIKKGEVIGLVDGDLKFSGDSMENVLRDLLSYIIEEKGQLVTIYYGESMDKHAVDMLVDKIKKSFYMQDFEIHNGGQPVYNLIVSVE